MRQFSTRRTLMVSLVLLTVVCSSPIWADTWNIAVSPGTGANTYDCRGNLLSRATFLVSVTSLSENPAPVRSAQPRLRDRGVSRMRPVGPNDPTGNARSPRRHARLPGVLAVVVAGGVGLCVFLARPDHDDAEVVRASPACSAVASPSDGRSVAFDPDEFYRQVDEEFDALVAAHRPPPAEAPPPIEIPREAGAASRAILEAEKVCEGLAGEDEALLDASERRERLAFRAVEVAAEDPAFLDALCRLAQESVADPELRRISMVLLGRMESEKALQTLLDMLETEPDATIRDWLVSSLSQDRGRAYDVHFHQSLRSRVGGITHLVAYDDEYLTTPQVVDALLRAYDRATTTDERALILSCMTKMHDIPGLRLGRWEAPPNQVDGFAAIDAAPIVERFLRLAEDVDVPDPTRRQKWQLAMVVDRLRHGNPEERAMLVRLAGSPHRTTRMEVVMSAASSAGEFNDLLGRVSREDPDKQVRYYAARSLLPSGLRQAVEVFLHDPEDYVRSQLAGDFAAKAEGGRILIEEARRVLRLGQSDPSQWVRWTSGLALERIDKAEPKIREMEASRRFLEEEEQAREEARRVREEKRKTREEDSRRAVEEAKRRLREMVGQGGS